MLTKSTCCLLCGYTKSTFRFCGYFKSTSCVFLWGRIIGMQHIVGARIMIANHVGVALKLKSCVSFWPYHVYRILFIHVVARSNQYNCIGMGSILPPSFYWSALWEWFSKVTAIGWLFSWMNSALSTRIGANLND